MDIQRDQSTSPHDTITCDIPPNNPAIYLDEYGSYKPNKSPLFRSYASDRLDRLIRKGFLIDNI